MQKLLTSVEMREIDRLSAERYGLSGLVLMEHAGCAVARAVARVIDWPTASADATRAVTQSGLRRRTPMVTIVCGKGNNGGDGLVAARWLARWGVRVCVYLTASADEVKGDARVNLDLLVHLGGAVVSATAPDEFAALRDSLAGSDAAVDALLGTGLAGAPREPIATAIRALAAADCPVVSVDIPSGVNSDTGEAYAPHVDATVTVTLGAWKRGLLLTPGAEATGNVELADIGLPEPLLDALTDVPAALEANDIAALLGRRTIEFHKGQAGRVLVVAGSQQFAGAALLCTRAACRAGAGLVSLFAPGLGALLRHYVPEAMYLAAATDANGTLATQAAESLPALLERADAIAVGPGLGRGEGAAKTVETVLHTAKRPVVVDADGLNLLAAHPEWAKETTAALVLTPHPVEAARLLQTEPERVLADRIGAAVAISRRYDAVVALKSARTIVAAPSGLLRVNPTGNPAMATGGMGDVLTGVIVGLLAGGVSPEDATQSGVWLHGAAGDLAAGGHGTEATPGLLASDVTESIPQARSAVLTGQYGGRIL